MRKKDVILDFTPLLDIILIILFFFILYSVFNVKESEERAEQARMAYEDKLDALDAEEARLGAEWERLRALDEKRCEWSPDIDNLLTKCTAAYHDKEHEFSIIYGDYYFLEALLKFCK